MLTLIRTDSNCTEFQELIKYLDLDLNKINGKMQEDYNKYNVISFIQTVVIAKEGDNAVGCGCFKEYEKDTVEIKRMFVDSKSRGKGISKKIINELEKWAIELGYSKVVLETGTKQREAIGLYSKHGYKQVANYGQYIGALDSICFEKELV